MNVSYYNNTFFFLNFATKTLMIMLTDAQKDALRETLYNKSVEGLNRLLTFAWSLNREIGKADLARISNFSLINTDYLKKPL